jgi:hypothetical protein
VSKISFAASLRSSAKLEMSRFTQASLKSLYEHPLFHGIKTMDEAKALWKAKIEESGNPEAYIWFLMETEDQFESVIYLGSRHNSGNGSDEPVTDQFVETYEPHYPHYRHMVVERRNPHDLAQLARATIFDSLRKCDCRTKNNCCERILSLEIDQLEIPVSEKLLMKKLIPGARLFSVHFRSISIDSRRQH